MKSYRYYDIVMSAFVATLLVSNITSSAKIADFGISFLSLPLVFDAGTLLFPLSYIFGDILTEVYGYAKARRVIWTGFACAALMSVYVYLVGKMPGESQWMQYAGDDAFAAILGGVGSGGIIFASLAAYCCGEFSNSFVLAKMKVAMSGRRLWMRTIGSTLVGQALDTAVFVLIASAFGVFPWAIALSLIVANFIFKVGIEILCTPLTYSVVRFLKAAEKEDFFDTKTDFNPFHLGGGEVYDT
ncbi:transporter [Candidatus Peregrinibacteria bacterium CG10_big_fil_rev_8_21_14_0_10_49_24]|nr:MAG: transporter [Candidatus Peregrinibacteria bacterium CG11_big_fil_rev_8_21_14_0_20_49_14]PIR50764.1 MAG: transporter [Candidatus Peregrinibacteria bacterium CG10_big_fil_rev_8_21_14_0_10_49_24]PJA68191.1 MAG: transporter [Candidatus Peregrinibacteria bacterium CG_4_9_14_3_um_filter_49_12]